MLSWNVRGLNASTRCLAVHEMVAATPCHLLCLQETKLNTIDQPLANFLGAYRLNRFAFKPATRTRGGVLLLWNDSAVDITDVRLGRFSISAHVTLRFCMTSFSITGVYGPSRRAEKASFLNHLRSLRPDNDAKWIVFGDFNLICSARDRNNRNLNLSLMRRFRQALDFCQLKEIKLQNRKFTWSNERRHPTLARLDRFFCNQSWELTFSSCSLHPLSTSHSDHCPLLLTNHVGPRRARPFKFENF
jgi:exonuclease III